MQMIDLFSGIGGFSLAGHWLGWETIMFCEMNPFGQKVLGYHFPGVPIYEDVKKLDYERIKKSIDPNRPTIVVGGFPCQPFSAAGKRLGTEDDRHLWPYCIETVRQLKPDFCVFENVSGLINWNGGMVFDEVQSDLEAAGYEVTPFLLPACGVNAPHRRDRIWFVAHAKSNRDSGGLYRMEGENGCKRKSEECRKNNGQYCNNGAEWDAPDTDSEQRRKRRMHEEGRKTSERYFGSFDTWNAGSAWSDFPTQPPVRSRNDGLSERLAGITVSKHRNESIKAYGNAVVPQVVYQIFKAIQQFEV